MLRMLSVKDVLNFRLNPNMPKTEKVMEVGRCIWVLPISVWIIFKSSQHSNPAEIKRWSAFYNIQTGLTAYGYDFDMWSVDWFTLFVIGFFTRILSAVLMHVSK